MNSDLHSFEDMAFVNAIALIVIDHFLGFDEVDWSKEMLKMITEEGENK